MRRYQLTALTMSELGLSLCVATHGCVFTEDYSHDLKILTSPFKTVVLHLPSAATL